jgi:phosphatidylglycerophosphate synthase
MPEYEPTSRRPIAQIFRRTADAATRWSVRRGIHPDVISYMSIFAALSGAICFWKSSEDPRLLIVGPLFCFLRLWFNMLDGMVAVASGKASARGEILNDLPDRVSDVIIFIAIAHSGWMNPFIGYWAAIFAVLTAYVGLFGQAVGGKREFGGVMSKPWRMVALSLGAWATFLCRSYGGGTFAFGPLTILDWTCLIVIVGCLQTIAVRLSSIARSLENPSR